MARYRWKLLDAGPLLLDGGSMFGLIPRVVWGKSIPTDDKNRITLRHNALVLESDAPGRERVVIESGSGDKLDDKFKSIFGLGPRTIESAVIEAGLEPESINAALVTHLHFDHAGGLTRLARAGESPDWTQGPLSVRLTFPRARVFAQRREWLDALAGNSVMTKTYFAENLEPLCTPLADGSERLRLIESPPPFAPGLHPGRDAEPGAPVELRWTEVMPGIRVLLTPGHTWGQQAILFDDVAGQTVVFTPDVMPTVHHVGATYNLAYDVEPYTSMLTRRWFLAAAARLNWLLVLDHEPRTPLVRVRANDAGWFTLVPETASPTWPH